MSPETKEEILKLKWNFLKPTVTEKEISALHACLKKHKISIKGFGNLFKKDDENISSWAIDAETKLTIKELGKMDKIFS